ncbi:MAG: hypothetical protein IPH57_04605 [Saprospiraceae bacterium]|nr:hypothetical protein [Saprospiraceae bacterium]
MKGILIISLYIFLIALSKIIPHQENYSAITGLVIFGGFMFGKKKDFFLITLVAIFVVDVIFNNFIHPEYFPERTGFILFEDYMIWVYLSYVLIIVLSSRFLKKFSYLKLLFTSLGSSIIFFLITNFAWLYSTQLYPRDFNGLLMSYAAALPFFRTSLISDLFFGFLIFGVYDFIIKRYFIRSSVFSLSK